MINEFFSQNQRNSNDTGLITAYVKRILQIAIYQNLTKSQQYTIAKKQMQFYF